METPKNPLTVCVILQPFGFMLVEKTTKTL